MGFPGGMEYPTITSISPVSSEKELEGTIEHEVGHNWLYGILASNERDHPWMDEGMNTYYDNRYNAEHQNVIPEIKASNTSVIKNKIPEDLAGLGLATITGIKTDQPIATNSTAFSEMNYGLIAYTKTGLWMKQLELRLGKPLFDSCMHAYYNQWQFKHPYPEDFKQVIDRVSGVNTDDLFAALNKKGTIPGQSAGKKSFKLTLGFNLKNTDQYQYISLLPAIGYNPYDKLMIGAVNKRINAIHLVRVNHRQILSQFILSRDKFTHVLHILFPLPTFL
jgi:aminopeptidase N